MGEFIVYSVKISLCLVMFYVFYKLLLSRTTLHTFNRFVILALVAVSMVLPFVHVTVSEPVVEGVVSIDQLVMMATVVEQERPEFHFSAINVAVLIYIIGVAVFFIRMLLSYAGIHRIMKRAGTVVDDDGVRIYVVDGDIAPFSWFRNIVISAADYRDNRRAIITHEKAHVARGHSVDILLCNILTVVQWFNPAAWLLKAELQDVHEYEADEAVLRSGIDATGYQLLLVRKAVGDRLFAIANNLSKDSLKKRITMMKTKKTNRWESMKALVVLPLAAIAVVTFASPEVAEVENEVVAESQQLMQAVEQQVTGQAVMAVTPATPAREVPMPAEASTGEAAMPETAPADTARSEKTYDVVETMPEFSGGTGEMMKYLVKNIRYPKEMEEQKVEGRVIVTFVVRKNGEITDAKVVKSVHPQLDAEALRIINGMPNWTPGMQNGKPVNVKFALPVSFKLDSSTGSVTKLDVPADKQVKQITTAQRITNANGSTPLIIVDGKKLSESEYKTWDNIIPDDIEKMEVLKAEKDIKQYGDEGKYGVIKITMKKK
ncbi:MAG: TonB family protein [Prevotella sp.]|nr:TonB family protein [Prevotella sp.]